MRTNNYYFLYYEKTGVLKYKILKHPAKNKMRIAKLIKKQNERDPHWANDSVTKPVRQQTQIIGKRRNMLQFQPAMASYAPAFGFVRDASSRGQFALWEAPLEQQRARVVP